ncbi:hypothetical protein [Neisseria meningitidis]|nr:hypothetical protein [Neisseria meningitidis]MCL5864530.1 hypothetical protein [Neisseria meningitidis]MCL5916600.1 hypothetical protein [Neisseria meningitidis]MCL6138228.1 hypothetical protein [Neisseria meningitidis]
MPIPFVSARKWQGWGKTKCRLKQHSVSDGIFLLPPKGKTASAMDAEAV